MSFIRPEKNNTRYLIALGFAIAIQVCMVWLLVSGLAQKATSFITQPMNARLIEELKHIPKEVPKPVAPKPQVIPKVYVPPTEVTPPIAVPTVQATVTPPPPAPPPSPPITPPVVVSSAKIDMTGGCQRPKYPESARMAGEEGAVQLAFLIGVDGKIKDNKILSSSGFRRLDIAARDALELCKFQPGTENGQPVESWAKIKYVWRLN